MKNRQHMALHFTDPKIYDADGDLTKNWFIEFYYWYSDSPSRRHRQRIYKGINKVTSFQDRSKSANKILERLRLELETGEWKPRSSILKARLESQIQWDAMITRYLNHQLTSNRRKSFQTHSSKFKIFLDWLEGSGKRRRDVEGFTRLDADNFFNWLKEKRNVSHTTYNNYRQLMVSIGNDMLSRREIFENPFDHIKRLKMDQRPGMMISEDVLKEITEHLKTTDPHLLMFCRFIFHLFLRPHSELRLMKVGWIDFERENLKIPAGISKNHKEAILPIPKSPLLDQIGYLRNYSKEKYVFSHDGQPGTSPVGKNHFQLRFKRALTHLKLDPEITVYSFKHTGAKMLLDNGASVKEVQMQMRHHSLEMTDRYLKSMQAFDSKAIRYRSPII